MHQEAGQDDMALWRLYYHLVWATKNREPLIAPEMEEQLFAVIAHKCHELGGWAYAISGMADHVHLIAVAPPKVAPAELARHVKGVSSHFVEAKFKMSFAWQRGYGIFSLSKHGLGAAIDYVRRQKEHHAAGTTIAALEHATDDEDSPSPPSRS